MAKQAARPVKLSDHLIFIFCAAAVGERSNLAPVHTR